MCQKHNLLIIKDSKKEKDVRQRTPHLHLRTLLEENKRNIWKSIRLL